MKTNDPLLQLIALKEQIEDLIDQLRSPAPAKPVVKKSPALKKSVRSKTKDAPAARNARLAIVVGHTKTAPGAEGVAPVNSAEYPWNSDLASRIASYGAGKGVDVRIFFRDVGGIPAAYDTVEAWGAGAAIELHFNAADGTARGTETLYGTACSGSAGWADKIQKSMVTLYGRTGTQIRGLKKCPPHPRGSASVNAMPDIPSCLIEPFFGDNPSDATLGQNKKQGLAEALVDGFKAHFGV
jgi:N-acetylmuramoyl-L-alanine amidase